MSNKGPTKLFSVNPAVGKPAVTDQNTGNLGQFADTLGHATSQLQPLVTVGPGPQPDPELPPLFTVEGAGPNLNQTVLFSTGAPTPGAPIPGAPGATPVPDAPGAVLTATAAPAPILALPPPEGGPVAEINPEIAAHFGDPADLEQFYLELARQLQERSDDKKFYGGKLRNMLPVAEYAREVALNQYYDVPDTDTAAKDQALLKFQTADLIFRKLESLKALSKSDTRFTQAQYTKAWEEINHLLEQQGIDERVRDQLKGSLDSAIQDNLFAKRKFYDTRYTGNTGFDTTQPTYKVKEKYQKRIKIEHEGGAVIGTFSYNRSNLLGTKPFGGHVKLWGGAQRALADLRQQSKEFVQVAINEYGKGTSPQKPIELYYTRNPLPEAALQILMEYKMEAIKRGQPFYAKNAAGAIIEISPQASFNTDEKAYFAQYAMEVPKARSLMLNSSKEANACAGYKLFKNVESSPGNKILTASEADRKDENKIFDAMTAHLAQQQKNEMGLKQGRMTQVEAALSAPRSESGMQLR